MNNQPDTELQRLKRNLAEAVRLNREAWEAYRECKGAPMECHELWAKLSETQTKMDFAAGALGYYVGEV